MKNSCLAATGQEVGLHAVMILTTSWHPFEIFLTYLGLNTKTLGPWPQGQVLALCCWGNLHAVRMPLKSWALCQSGEWDPHGGYSSRWEGEELEGSGPITRRHQDFHESLLDVTSTKNPDDMSICSCKGAQALKNRFPITVPETSLHSQPLSLQGPDTEDVTLDENGQVTVI